MSIDMKPKANEECKATLVCPANDNCKARLFLNIWELGERCSCENPTPNPNICQGYENGKETAILEYIINVICRVYNESCDVKECWEYGKPGYICDCTTTPTPTPVSSVPITLTFSATAILTNTFDAPCYDICHTPLCASALASC